MPRNKRGLFEYGDVWTWVAIDADMKLVSSFMLGNRDARTARVFLQDLASRLDSRIHLTIDELRVYLDALERRSEAISATLSWLRFTALARKRLATALRSALVVR